MNFAANPIQARWRGSAEGEWASRASEVTLHTPLGAIPAQAAPRRAGQGRVREVYDDSWKQRLLPERRPPSAAPAVEPPQRRGSPPTTLARPKTYDELVRDIKRKELEQAQQRIHQPQPSAATLNIFALGRPHPDTRELPAQPTEPILASRRAAPGIFAPATQTRARTAAKRYQGLDADQLREVLSRRTGELSQLEEQWCAELERQTAPSVAQFKLAAVQAKLGEMDDEAFALREIALSAEAIERLNAQISARNAQLSALERTPGKTEQIGRILAARAQTAKMRRALDSNAAGAEALLREKSERGFLEQIEQTRGEIAFDDDLLRRLQLLLRDKAGKRP